MMDCIFCKIVNKEIPANIIYEDDLILSFMDIHPQAPFHALVIPKKHIILDMASKDDKKYFGDLIYAAKIIAEENLLEKGYRLVINNGPDSNQEVEHLHMHLLSGKNLGKMAT